MDNPAGERKMKDQRIVPISLVDPPDERKHLKLGRQNADWRWLPRLQPESLHQTPRREIRIA
jgi:hypothetical protein